MSRTRDFQPGLRRLKAHGYESNFLSANKFEMLKRRVPRLRRVSVSPWCDIEKAVAALGSRYIFSWKFNPAMLAGRFDADRIRANIRKTLDTARGCVVEIIHKDLSSIENEPQRLETWTRICREEAERQA